VLIDDQRGDGAATAEDLEAYRGELVGYCYRMLGSAPDAEDAVQLTLTKAWRALDRFEGRSSLRTWLYRIASNVCFDELRAGQRRARPMDLSGPWEAQGPIGEILPEATWIGPLPDDRVRASMPDPAAAAEVRESLRLAFVAALQHLPARQRAALILCEVLRWPAAEVAQLLETSTASVNSALQRARATLDATTRQPAPAPTPPAEIDEELLARYLDAFERYDMAALEALIHEDAVQSMPPYELWLSGRDQILWWWQNPGAACRGSRMLRTSANGCPAFAQYRPSGPGGRHEPWALHVLQLSGDRIGEFTMFLDTETLFPLFGLPDHPDDP
jgi:RNA polymerase sigma-70 factor (ECF subfamily)